MKEHTDVGLKHIQNLGIRTARDIDAVVKKISEITGNKNTTISMIEGFYKKSGNCLSEIDYEKKNSDYEIAMAFSGAYDADIIRKACNWISEHKEYFGKEILEIGCDCGFMTTFLASTFPDSHITSIDINLSGLNIAKKNVESFELNNVTFECKSANDVNQKFDTVFSMRTMHENLQEDEPVISIADFQEQGKSYKKQVLGYAKSLSELVSPNGFIVSIERVERNPLFLGWLEALSDNKLYLKTETYEELKCTEVGDESIFQACIIGNEENNPYESFLICTTKYMDTSLGEYKDWEARCMYEIQRGIKLREDIYKDSAGNPVMKLACWTHRNDETCILYFQDNGSSPYLAFYDISRQEEIFANMDATKKQAISTGYKLLG